MQVRSLMCWHLPLCKRLCLAVVQVQVLPESQKPYHLESTLGESGIFTDLLRDESVSGRPGQSGKMISSSTSTGHFKRVVAMASHRISKRWANPLSMAPDLRHEYHDYATVPRPCRSHRVVKPSVDKPCERHARVSLSVGVKELRDLEQCCKRKSMR